MNLGCGSVISVGQLIFDMTLLDVALSAGFAGVVAWNLRLPAFGWFLTARRKVRLSDYADEYPWLFRFVGFPLAVVLVYLVIDNVTQASICSVRQPFSVVLPQLALGVGVLAAVVTALASRRYVDARMPDAGPGGNSGLCLR